MTEWEERQIEALEAQTVRRNDRAQRQGKGEVEVPGCEEEWKKRQRRNEREREGWYGRESGKRRIRRKDKSEGWEK